MRRQDLWFWAGNLEGREGSINPNAATRYPESYMKNEEIKPYLAMKFTTRYQQRICCVVNFIARKALIQFYFHIKSESWKPNLKKSNAGGPESDAGRQDACLPRGRHGALSSL